MTQSAIEETSDNEIISLKMDLFSEGLKHYTAW